MSDERKSEDMRSELEKIICEYGPYIPKEKRAAFYEDLADLMTVSGSCAVDDFIERFKANASRSLENRT